jgi:hypothetical protein
MAFAVPTFNLTAAIWTGPYKTKIHRFDVRCNLAFGRRIQQPVVDDLDAYSITGTLQMALLFPALTDLHDFNSGHDNDVIECPIGTGRWYGLIAYDDVGKGFSNEYRLAVVSKISEAVNPTEYPGLLWPTPTP